MSESLRSELFSIGHSRHSAAAFVDLLNRYSIETVVDVRTAPYSRFNPQFNRRDVEGVLRDSGIGYVFMGKELGGRPDGAEFYDPDEHVLYGRMAESPIFQAGIERLLGGSSGSRAAIMCSEEDPADCHRYLLVTRVLRDRDVAVMHIRGDGSLQITEDVRTFKDWSDGGHEQGSLFDSSMRSPWRSTRSVSRGRPPQSSSER